MRNAALSEDGQLPPAGAATADGVSRGLPATRYRERLIEVFSPGIHTPLKGPVGVAGQGFCESSATSGEDPRRKLPAGGTRCIAGTGADLQRCLSQTSADGESWCKTSMCQFMSGVEGRRHTRLVPVGRGVQDSSEVCGAVSRQPTAACLSIAVKDGRQPFNL